MGLVWVQEKVNIREQSDDQDYKNLELNGGYLVIKDQNAKNFNMRGQFGHYYPKLWTNLDKNFRSWGYFRENSDIFWGYFGQLLLSVCGSNYQQGHFWKADIYWGCWDRELLLLFKGFFRYFWQIWDQFCTGFCSRLLTVIRYVYELSSIPVFGIEHLHYQQRYRSQPRSNIKPIFEKDLIVDFVRHQMAVVENAHSINVVASDVDQ
ncbi:hypothetical protein LXL04_024819 [Taraxacum kok-saghyz]